jgi:hypothetical protein
MRESPRRSERQPEQLGIVVKNAAGEVVYRFSSN